MQNIKNHLPDVNVVCKIVHRIKLVGIFPSMVEVGFEFLKQRTRKQVTFFTF